MQPTQVFTNATPGTNLVFTLRGSHAALGIPLWFIGLIVLIVAIGGILEMRAHLRLSWALALPLSLLTIAAAAGAGWYRWAQISEHGRLVTLDDEDITSIIAAALLPVLAIPFAAKLILKWTGTNLTEREKSPGLAGVRAWLGVGNVIFALLVPLCAWWGFGCSYWAILVVALMAILAYPILNPSAASPSTTETKMQDLTPERERILKMLDDGKITAQESADLLNALGHSTPPRPAQSASAVSAHRRLVLIGGALVLIGFFLPWLSINVGKATSQKMGQIQQSLGQTFGMALTPNLNLDTGTTNIAGGDVPHGLGWIILLLGLAVAVLPYFATNLDRQVIWKAGLAGLGVGIIILIYLLYPINESVRYMNIGILLVLAGYALEFIGTLKQRSVVQQR